MMFNEKNIIGKKVYFPHANFNDLKQFIITTYQLQKEHGRQFDIYSIAKSLGTSTSEVTNAGTIALDLGLIYRNKSYYRLTEHGNELAQEFNKGNFNEIERIGKQQIFSLKKSPVFYHAYYVYKQNTAITPYELSEEVSRKLNKIFKSEKTYKRVGKNLLDILNGFHLINLKNAKLEQTQKVLIHSKNILKGTDDKLLPRISAGQIKGYIKKFKGNEPMDLIFPNLSDARKGVIHDHLIVIENLGLIQHEYNGYYRLTENGFRYKESLNTIDEKKIFQEILLKYEPIKFIIKEINDTNTVSNINFNLLGQLIGRYNKIKYAESSIQTYGTKLASWLKEADIIIPKGKNHAVLNPIFLQGLDIKSEVEKKSDIPDSKTDSIHLICEIYNNYFKIKYNGYGNNENKIKILSNLDRLRNLLPDEKLILEVAKNCFIEGIEQNKWNKIEDANKLIHKIAEKLIT